MISRLPRVAKVLGTSGIAVGLLSIVGSFAGLQALTHPFGGLTMKVNAALAVTLAGASLWVLADANASPRRQRAARVSAALVLLIGGVTLLEYVLGVDLRIDSLLFAEPDPTGTLRSGRMAPTTALGLLLLGGALLTIDRRWRSGWRPAEFLTLGSFLIGLVASTDFIYSNVAGSVPELYRQMAMYTALSLMGLSLGVLFARPDQGITGIISEKAAGGELARRLLPAIVLVSTAVGGLRLEGEHLGLYDMEFGTALMVSATIGLLAALVLSTAKSLNHSARESRALEAERARVREQLGRANSLVDAIVENLPLMIFVKDAEQLTFVRINRAGEDLLGLSREALLGKNDYDFFPADQAEHFQAKDRETLASKVVVELEEPINSPSGRRWLHTRKVTILGPDARPAFLLGISEDITQRKQKDDALAQWAHIFQHANWGIAVLSADGRTLERVNAAFARMHGHEMADLAGRPVRDLLAPEEWEAAARNIARAEETGEETFQTLRLRKDGTRFPALVSVSTVRDAAGKTLYRAANVQDISAIRETEEELRRARDVAEATSRELEAFSYSVSHDLRAPLRSIDGFSQALLEDQGDRLDDAGRDHLARVRGAAQRMAQLIDDLLDLSRVTRAELQRKPVDLTAAAREVAAALTGAAPERRVRFEIAEGLSTRGDPRLLRVLLDNLIGNAWKFTSHRASATIEVGRGTENGAPYFFVRDDGAGFDMAYASKLFGAFQRLHRETEFEGTGIGLATVQRIVQRHGGQIWADSRVNEGAIFRFTLWPHG